MFVYKVSLCFVVILCFVRNIDGDDQHGSGSFSGIAFEMLLTKLDLLQEHLFESDKKMTELSQTIDHKLAVLQTETKAAMKEHRDHIDHESTVLQTETKAAMKEHRDHIDHKITVLQTETKVAMKEHRDHIDQKLSELSKTMVHQFTTLKTESNVMLEKYKEPNDQKLNHLIQTVDDKFKALQNHSNKTEQSSNIKHEQMQKEIQKLASKKDLVLYKNYPDIFLGASSYISCKKNPSNQSGKYFILFNKHDTSVMGYCDHSVFGGGWLVFQYRFDGSVDFYRNWESYRDGFGNLEGEFWLGLEHLHQLTSVRKYELLVELKDYAGVYVYARYAEFEIGSEAEKYALKKLGDYSGTAGDSLKRQLGMQFTTKDQDNDYNPSVNCAVVFKGPWWYNGCSFSNLNGIYKNANGWEYMIWYNYKSSTKSMAYTRMSVREI